MSRKYRGGYKPRSYKRRIPFPYVVFAAGRRPPGIDAGRGAQNCGRDKDAMTQSSTGRFYAPAAALRDGRRPAFRRAGGM